MHASATRVIELSYPCYYLQSELYPRSDINVVPVLHPHLINTIKNRHSFMSFRAMRRCEGTVSQARSMQLSEQTFNLLAPACEIVNNRVSSAPCNYPLDVLIAVVHLLMLSIRRNEGKVTRG
jgi:hypothetical protein